jgi:hypothetical protein
MYKQPLDWPGINHARLLALWLRVRSGTTEWGGLILGKHRQQHSNTERCVHVYTQYIMFTLYGHTYSCLNCLTVRPCFHCGDNTIGLPVHEINCLMLKFGLHVAHAASYCQSLTNDFNLLLPMGLAFALALSSSMLEHIWRHERLRVS